MTPDSTRARALFLHRFILRSALSAGGIFAWVIIFRLFFIETGNLEYALAGVGILYALSHAITFILTPLTGAALRFGVRRALVFGTILQGTSFTILSFIFLGDAASREYVFFMIATFVILHGLARALYWIPYRTEEAQGIARSPAMLVTEMVIALIPALAGYLGTTLDHGIYVLLIGVALSILLSATFLFRIPESHEPYVWSYGQTLAQLLARRNHSAVGLFIFDGMQGAALLFLWPLAAFLILGESFQALGAVLTATLCIAFLGRWIARRVMRRLRVSQSPYVIASIVFSSWLFRLAAGTPLQLLAVDVYYHSGNATRRFSIDAFAHEQIADGGHFVDEFTAVKEMSLALGRILICALFCMLVLCTSEALAFAAAILVAAISGAASVFLAQKAAREAF